MVDQAHLELVGLADVGDLVQRFIEAVQGEVLLLPDLVHLQQPPQVTHLYSTDPFSPLQDVR